MSRCGRVACSSKQVFCTTPRAADARLFARIQKYRIESDYGPDFALTPDALREDLGACEGFLARARAVVAQSLG
jgi:hypothetical protein